MRINNIDDIITLRMEPERALKLPKIRYQHFMRCYLDHSDDFLVGYCKGSLIFSDRFTYSEIEKHEKLFRNFAKAKDLDSRGQETRMNKIKKIFGKQGEAAAMNLFADIHKLKRTGKKQSTDYLYVYLSDADREKLFAAQKNCGANDLTENQFARQLLERELQRLFPETPAQEIRRAEP